MTLLTDLQELARLSELATEGAWYAERNQARMVLRGPEDKYLGTVDHAQGVAMRDANSKFIIAAVNFFRSHEKELIELAKKVPE